LNREAASTQLADNAAHRLAHRGRDEVELTCLSRRQKLRVVRRRQIAGFDLSTEVGELWKIVVFRSNQASSGKCRFDGITTNLEERSWLEKRIDVSLSRSLDWRRRPD
jgi:hypothetical protein